MGWRWMIAIAGLALVAAGAAQAATLEVGPDKPYKQPSQAAKPGSQRRSGRRHHQNRAGPVLSSHACLVGGVV
jgi:hypothetical protein